MIEKVSKNKKTKGSRNKDLAGMLDGADVRLPPSRRLFILDENELNSLILRTIFSQYLTFLGGTLANFDGTLVIAEDLSMSIGFIGVTLSLLGILSWVFAIYRKIGKWKKQLAENSD